MIKQQIINGDTYLGIELGSTRIKACLIDKKSFMPVASGSADWENRFENGYWTYSLEDIHNGIRECYARLCDDVLMKYGTEITVLGSIGISAMMHGYLVFDKDDNLLVPFRTWRNTGTERAARELSDLFDFNIPQRWSIAHLYESILNNETHVKDIAHITTLSGYIHYLLTGKWEIGICDASGIFPVSDGKYDDIMLDKFALLTEKYNFNRNIRDILPEIRTCGFDETRLTEKGAEFIDKSGKLKADVIVCPPEGDMGTGMIATNSIKKRTCSISAGTSVNSVFVLENNLSEMYPDVDIIATPDGSPAAMIHSNNGCSEIDVWVNIFAEFADIIGADTEKSDIYGLLYKIAADGDSGCGGVIAYNFLAAEPVLGVKKGNPMYCRSKQGSMSLANFMRAQLYSVIAPVKAGTDMLIKRENVQVDGINAHGGLFKVEGVAQQILAGALNLPVFVCETAGEGGAWGMALLAAYAAYDGNDSLDKWLDVSVFNGFDKKISYPDESMAGGFKTFFERYKNSVSAVDCIAE